MFAAIKRTFRTLDDEIIKEARSCDIADCQFGGSTAVIALRIGHVSALSLACSMSPFQRPCEPTWRSQHLSLGRAILGFESGGASIPAQCSLVKRIIPNNAGLACLPGVSLCMYCTACTVATLSSIPPWEWHAWSSQQDCAGDIHSALRKQRAFMTCTLYRCWVVPYKANP